MIYFFDKCSGMDPAGPLFTKWPKSLKLDSADAEFVDVIHTDAGIFGYPRAVGHVDFWPNRGISPQPGCGWGEIKLRNPDSIIEPCKLTISVYQFINVFKLFPDSPEIREGR